MKRLAFNPYARIDPLIPFTIDYSLLTIPHLSPYPLLLHSFTPDLQLYIPDPLEIKTVYERSKLADPSLPFPYWAKVWPAAIALTRFLERSPELTAKKRVLEIGAGTGLPSFSIARQTGSLIVSDQDPDAVELMKKNIALLALKNTSALQIDWNHFPPAIKADTILLSDINYAPEQFGILQRLIFQWINEGSTIVLATPQRIMAIPFVEKTEPYLMDHQTEEVLTTGERTLISILILGRPDPAIV